MNLSLIQLIVVSVVVGVLVWLGLASSSGHPDHKETLAERRRILKTDERMAA